jgi:hypothetical protein
MQVQLSQNLDVLEKTQVQSRNQQHKIYQKYLSLARGKKLCPFLSSYVIDGLMQAQEKLLF